MSTVDERIVRMDFDNTGFEAGAAKAVELLSKLEEALHLEGAVSGINEVRSSFSKFNTSSVDSSLDETGAKFDWLREIGVGALRELGAEGVRLGKQLVSSISDSMTKSAKAGFGEYELQMKSLQTISANSGEEMDVINKNLDALNEYADKTIYVFSDMTQNIGRFTAAGLDVETSTKAIKGFANAAALAGAGTQETSRGMYQLSQAMAAGVVKLQDWKSIQNASIDTEAFKEVLIETARVMNETENSVDKAIETEGSFNASLQHGWLTAGVMSQALNVLQMSTRDFADEEEGLNQRIKELAEMGYSEKVARNLISIANNADDSAREVRTFTQMMETMEEALGTGWADTWKIIIGDFDEATEFFTTISQRFDAIIGGMSDARNNMLKVWKEKGGRDSLIGIFANTFEAIRRIIIPIKDAFSSVFGISGKQLAVFTENLALLSEKFVISKKKASKLNSTFLDIFVTLHELIGTGVALMRVLPAIGKTLGVIFSPLTKSLLSTTKSFGTVSIAIRSFVEKTVDIFTRMLKPIRRSIKEIYDIIFSFFKALKRVIRFSEFYKTISKIGSTILKFVGVSTKGFKLFNHTVAWYFIHPFKLIKDALVKFGGDSRVNFFTKWLLNIGRVITGPFKAAFAIVSPAINFFAGILNTAKTSVEEFVNSILNSAPIEKISNFWKNLIPKSETKGSQPLSEETESVNSFSGAINTMFSALKAGDFSKFTGAITSFGTSFYSQAKTYVKGSKVLSKSKAVLSSFGKKVLPVVSKAFETFKTTAKGFAESVSKKIGSIDFAKIKTQITSFATSVVESIKKFAPSLWTNLQSFGKTVVDTFNKIVDGTFSFSGTMSGIKDTIDKTLANLPAPVKSLFDQIVNSVKWCKDRVTEEIHKMDFGNIGVNLSKAGEVVGNAVSSFVDGITSVPDVAGNVFNDMIEKAKAFIGDFPSFEELASMGDILLKGGLLASIIGFINSLKNLNKTISNMGKGIIDWPKNFGDALGKFGRGFNEWRQETKADAIVKIAGALTMLSGALFILASIPAEDLARAGRAMGVMAVGMASFLGVVILLDNFKKINPATLAAVGTAIGGLGIGVLALSAAAFALSKIPEEDIARAIPTIIQLVTAVSLYSAALRGNGGSLLKGSIGLVIFAGALNLLIGVVEKLGTMEDQEALTRGVKTFTDIMITLSIFGLVGAKGIGLLLGAFMKFGVGVALLSLSLVVLAAGLEVMSDSLKKITNLEDVIWVVGGALLAFTTICWALQKVDTVGIGLGLLEFAGAILIMSFALAGLSAIKWNELLPNVAGLFVLIGEFGLIAAFVKPDQVIKTAQALAIFGGAVLVMSGAFYILGMIGDNISTVVSAVKSMAGLILEFGVLAALVDGGQLVSAASGILIFSVAVLAISGAFKVLETVDMSKVIGPLIAVMATFGLFAAAAAALSPAAIGIALIAKALMIFSLSVLALAAAFWLFSSAVKNLNDVGPQQISEVMSGFGEGLGKILDEAIARMPSFIDALVKGILNGLGTLAKTAIELITKFGTWLTENNVDLVLVGAELLKKIVEGIKSGWASLKDLAAKVIPSFVAGITPFLGEVKTCGLSVIDTLKTSLGSVFSDMLEVGKAAVGGLIKGLADGSLLDSLKEKAISIGTTIIDSIKGFLGIASPSKETENIGKNCIEGMISGITDGSLISSLGESALGLATSVLSGLVNLPGNVINKAVEAGTGFLQGFSGFAGRAYTKGSQISKSVISGVSTLSDTLKSTATSATTKFVSVLSTCASKAKTIGIRIVTSIKTGLSTLVSTLKSKASDAVSKFISALSSGVSRAKRVGSELASKVVSGVGSLYSKLRSAASDGVQGFINGLGDKAGSLYNKAMDIGRSALNAIKKALKIASPSKELRKVGDYAIQGLILGFLDEAKAVYDTSAFVANKVPKAFEESLKAMSIDVEDLIETDYTPVISPVIDPTKFNSDMNYLASTLGSRMTDTLTIGNVNYTGELINKISDFGALSRQMASAIEEGVIDYDKLGVSVANALIASGVHVEMDGGELMGYLAGEIRDVRRMYG